MVSVVCVGIAVMDFIFAVDTLPEGQGRTFASALRETGGGPAATGAVAAARLGARTSLWARTGDDDLGGRIIADLDSLGVDTTHVRRVRGGRSSLSAVMVDGAGERAIVNYVDPGLDPDAAWLPLEDLARTQALLVHPRWAEGAAAALARAADLGLPAVLDADVAPESSAADAFALASHLLFSQDALAGFAGSADPLDGLRWARGRTANWVGVTAGGDGCYWLEDGTLRHLPGFRVPVVDTLGAGDVFHGAFAVALGEGRPVADALRFAAAAAALKCGRFGGRAGIPDRAEVDRFLAGAA
ncbi:MAG: ribokinase [Hyphomicrobiales bacterium]|nr:ribokinase [Hyphomicrobiales bacterium]MCP5371269.1 ribokinase [Hyphomicrobiales bacterium]